MPALARRCRCCALVVARWPGAAATTTAAPAGPDDPSPRCRAACRSRSAPPQDPQASDASPRRRARPCRSSPTRSAAARRWASPAPSSRGRATNRLAFGVIDDTAGFVYGKTAIYFAKHADSAGQGPVPGARRRAGHRPAVRSRAGGDGGGPVRRRLRRAASSCPASRAPTRSWRSRSSTASPWPRPGQIKAIAPGDDRIPAVGDAAPRVETDTVASARGDLESIDTRRADERPARGVASPRSLGKKPVALLFATPQLCQSRVCGPVVDVALQLKARYGDQVTSSTRRSTWTTIRAKGLREPLQQFGLPSEPWLFVDRQRRQDHRAARGLVRARRVRAGAQDRAVSTRARLALAASRGGGPRRSRDRAGPRPRPAHQPADPGVALRLGGGDRARRLLRRARRAVADAAAAARPGCALARRLRPAPRQRRGANGPAGLIGVALLRGRRRWPATWARTSRSPTSRRRSS